MDETNDWRAAIDPAEVALFLDVDGTLLGFKDRPEDVVADDALRRLLESLERMTDGALALVSGRAIADLDRIMAPLVFASAGTHGAEMRWPDGRRETAEAAALADIRPAVRAFAVVRDGLIFEDKGAALTVHFRLAPTFEREVSRFLEEVVTGHDLVLQRGNMVVEVKSATSSKGKAIERFMETSPFAGRRPVFLGDDLTDESGFESVNAIGGLSIKVGSPEVETIARQRLAGVAEVRALLQRIEDLGVHR